MKIIGYHGTNAGAAEKIIKNDFRINTFKHTVGAKQNMPGDLGNGVYLYIDDKFSFPKMNAEKFSSRFTHNNASIKVLEVTVQISEKNILDMDDSFNIDTFWKFRKDNKKRASNIFKDIKQGGAKNRGNLDGIFLELFIKRYNVPAMVVRKKTFSRFNDVEKKSSYPNGTELCIRKLKCIINKKILE